MKEREYEIRCPRCDRFLGKVTLPVGFTSVLYQYCRDHKWIDVVIRAEDAKEAA